MPSVVHNLLIIALWLCYNNPMKHKRFGFTIVELIVVIVVIAILVSITSLAYRETQKNARNEARKTDVAVLMGAIEEYRADKGDYPKNTITCDAPGTSTTQCWRDEIWTMLKDQGYLREIPHPDASAPTPAYNTAGGGKANYGYIYGSPAQYSIYVSLEPANTSCYTGKNPQPLSGVFTSACSF